MLDLRQIREQPDGVAQALADKGGGELIRQIVDVDGRRRQRLRETEDLKAERNRVSEAIGQARRSGVDVSAEMARMRDVGDRVKVLDGEVKAIDAELDGLLVQVPNLPHPSVPRGRTDDDNVEVRTWGTPRVFEF